ncbi:hypothetical protein BBO99_00001732 [Phytophthora kernoviae]|uniref:GYF domain-containing protein n=2 Tax=Phytophthora kernoviae TaxID=325452 RepID=A0A3R7KN29_9STRA|nr:hypothetical protein G195_002285 [Phytophthora kernoviae 00238/432]KAG2530912.1 hypothetical protein JM16_001417 [Phytophthora kernoviae]KAG2531979.1 hypothetical protein JM18_001499 [Phytophthora kernoviae]RLN36715.1 hypothetical protein BBI17_001515 [Phytophthora kernoviae]RLN83876.1 hypothetical protein BBO99_00001732 [Phytophthora kernoviae]
MHTLLRYTKEELLALHFTTTEMPLFPPETMVASDHCLPPVSTLPFDYEEIYKQWSLNRNRGRGRGRGNAPPGGLQGTRGHQERRGDGKWEETDNSKQRGEEHRHNEKDSTWERGVRVTEESRGDDVWDDVLEPGADSNEMDLSSMAEAAEKFRREMDAMREELEGPKPTPNNMKDDLDAFDKKLEDAAAAGQFDDSDNEETQWDEPSEKNSASGLVESQDQTTNSLGRQSSGSHLFDALEPTGDQFVFEEKSNFSLSQLPVDEGLSSLRLEVEDEWFYLDPQGLQQGPFKTAEMREWFEAGYFKPHLPIRFGREGAFAALANQFNEEKRRSVDKVRESLIGDNESGHSQPFNGSDVSQEQRKDALSAKSVAKDKNVDHSNEKEKASPKKNRKQGVKNETNAWTTSAPSSSKSLKDIQQEEQREMRSQMGDDNSGTANLAQMGAQLKMMLGVDSMAVAPNAPSAPTSEPTASASPAPVPTAASVASPWGAPTTAVSKNTTASKKQSMRDILAEEERLAQERTKVNASVPTNSHWMNIVAGNTVAAAAIPKPSRSVLGPVPASVLKSRQQIRAANGAAKPSPPKSESDASFWNFGAAQSVGADPAAASGSAQVGSANAFGSSASSEFMAWASKQLQTIDSNANVTLLEYCASVEDPGEIREYLAAYLGSTPRVSAFATEFIQRKKTQHSGKKSPGHQDAQQRAAETGSSNKRGKRRTKGQKVDPSLLNYSVGS